MITATTVLSAIIGGTMVRVFGDEIDEVNKQVRDWVNHHYPKLTTKQRSNLDKLVAKSSTFEFVDYSKVSPADAVMIWEWMNSAKDIDPTKDEKLADLYTTALERILESNYDLINSLKELTVDELRELSDRSPVSWELGQKLEKMGLGQLEDPMFKLTAGYKDAGTRIIIFGVISFCMSIASGLLFYEFFPQLGPIPVMTIMFLVLFSIVYYLNKFERSYDPSLIGARFLYAPNYKLRFSWKGRHTMYDMFPDTYTRKDGKWIYGEPWLEVKPASD